MYIKQIKSVSVVSLVSVVSSISTGRGFGFLEKPVSIEVLQTIRSLFSKCLMLLCFCLFFEISHKVTGPCLVSITLL
jgi:hypothetical protein